MDDLQRDNWEALAYRISDEGMDYCFMCYSDWDEIKDEKFQELKKQYVQASKQLSKYIDTVLSEAGIDTEEEW